MHHKLTEEADAALAALDQGAVMNCMHTTARELIAAGLAFDGWGKLEITESGRRTVRSGDMVRSFVVDDPNIANLHVESRRGGEMFELAPIAPEIAGTGDLNEPMRTVSEVSLPWSRQRAIQAAGLANGSTGIWVDQRWVAAFLDAYES
jgi:hypothetical protein